MADCLDTRLPGGKNGGSAMCRNREEGSVAITTRVGGCFAGALVLALGLGAASANCQAGEVQHPSTLAILVSSNALSDAAMASEKGTGLRPQDLLDSASRHPSVTLWDEMKLPLQAAPPLSGAQTPPTVISR
jgi:hypothetical protein